MTTRDTQSGVLSNQERRDLAILLAITLLAAFLRFWQLDILPPGLHHDEAVHGVQAQAILQTGKVPVFAEENFGQAPLFMALVALSFSVFGASGWAIRAVSAFVGTVTVPALYFLTRELFADRGPKTASCLGLLASLILASLYWHLSLSRYGLEQTLPPLFETLTLYLLWHAWERRSLRAALCAGVLLGGSLYTYWAAYALPVLVGMFFLIRAIFEQGFLRRRWLHSTLVPLMALATYAPMAQFILQRPEVFFKRPGQVLVSGPGRSLDAAGLLQNTWNSVALFIFAGDQDPFRNLPGRPALDVFLSLGFLIGLVVALRDIKKPHNYLVLLWLALGLVPTIVAELPPHFGRAISAVPPMTILTALGLLKVWQRIGHIAGSQPGTLTKLMRRGAAFAFLSGGLVFSLWTTYCDYFQVWASDPGLFYAFNAGVVAAAESVRQAPTGDRVYLTPLSRIHPTIVFTLQGQRDLQSYDGRRCMVVPGSADTPATYVVVTHEDQRSVSLLKRLFPGGSIIQEVADAAGQPYLSAYRVPGSARSSFGPQVLHPATLDEQVRLLGYTLASSRYRPGEAIPLTLFWQAQQRMERAYTVFVQMLGPRNPSTGTPVWAQRDTEPCDAKYPTTDWVPGDVVMDEYLLSIPSDTPPGQYTLEVGMYHLATLKRLPAFDADTGQHLDDDRILLQEVEILAGGH